MRYQGAILERLYYKSNGFHYQRRFFMRMLTKMMLKMC